MPPCGGHHVRPKYPVLGLGFQVVPPCGGHRIAENLLGILLGFKSCPRVGGIIGCNINHQEDPVVSSRAPVWGASLDLCGGRYCVGVSSRAPVWGASADQDDVFIVQIVSSRAPRVGGILLIDLKGFFPNGFKSCPRVGGIARPARTDKSSKALFQVVPPCGGHLSGRAILKWQTGFKSCPRVGGMVVAVAVQLGQDVSSRAPVWGAL